MPCNWHESTVLTGEAFYNVISRHNFRGNSSKRREDEYRKKYRNVVDGFSMLRKKIGFGLVYLFI